MKRTLATVISTVAIAISPMAVANAAPAPVTGVETTVNEDQWVAVPAEFDYAAAEAGFQAQKELRAEMWDINPPFNGIPLRQAAANAGMNTKEQYVNGFKLDYKLSKIAVQRSAEQINGLSHKRPSGTDCAWNGGNSSCLESAWTATINGQQAWGENIAAGNKDIKTAVKQSWGHGELAALRATNGNRGANNGHLHSALNPENKYHGFGLVKQLEDTSYRYYATALFSSTPLTGGDQPLQKGAQRLNLYRAAVKGETPTGIQDFKEPGPTLPGLPDLPSLPDLGDMSSLEGITGSLEGEGSEAVMGIIGLLAGVGILVALLGGISGQIHIQL